jgi:hypothetical protein
MALAVRELRSPTTLRIAPTRFFLHDDHVEHGGDDGGHSEVWGFPNRRWEVVVRELGFRDFGWLIRRKGNWGLLCALYPLRRALAINNGGDDRGTWPLHRGGKLPCVDAGEDEDKDLIFGLIRVKGYWAGLGRGAGLLYGLLLSLVAV